MRYRQTGGNSKSCLRRRVYYGGKRLPNRAAYEAPAAYRTETAALRIPPPPLLLTHPAKRSLVDSVPQANPYFSKIPIALKPFTTLHALSKSEVRPVFCLFFFSVFPNPRHNKLRKTVCDKTNSRAHTYVHIISKTYWSLFSNHEPL